MGTYLCYILMIGIVTARNIGPEVGEIGQRIVRANNVDGYSLATLHALDTATGQLTGQSKRDIEAHAADSTSSKSDFSLVLSSGERLRMTLTRRSVDTSGATVTVEENGKRDTSELQARDCFFSGPLEGEKGFASLSMCGGRLMGSVSTAKRQYEVHAVSRVSGDKRSADDVMSVLLTWKNTDTGSQRRHVSDLFKGIKTPDEYSPVGDKKRTVEDRQATVEIADYVDAHHVKDLENYLDITTDDDIVNHMLNKWSAAAQVLGDEEWVGWNITLRIIHVVIWRTNPDWYVTSASDDLMTRMSKVCTYSKDNSLPYDHLMLHTGTPLNEYLLGVAWIGGFCSGKYKCGSLRTVDNDFYPELHEFGHSIGLDHEGEMSECASDGDSPGFMGGTKDHFRACYRDVIDYYFSHYRKTCIFKYKSPTYTKEYNY